MQLKITAPGDPTLGTFLAGGGGERIHPLFIFVGGGTPLRIHSSIRKFHYKKLKKIKKTLKKLKKLKKLCSLDLGDSASEGLGWLETLKVQSGLS